MPTLSNSHLKFSFDPNTAQWSLHSRQPALADVLLENVRVGGTFRVLSGRQLRWLGEVVGVEAAAEAAPVASPHGRLQTLAFELTPGPAALRSVRVRLEFALPQAQPFLLWRLTARNVGGQPLALEALDLAVAPVVFPSPQAPRCFANGYQSWSFAGALGAGQRQPASGLGPFSRPAHLNLVTPLSRWAGRFASDLFGVLGVTDRQVGLVAGFIAQREQFGHLQVDFLGPGGAAAFRLTAQCDGVTLAPGEARVTDWAYLQLAALDGADPLGDYVDAVAGENQARVPAHTPVGWCSWYHYFDKVTEADVTSNLAIIAQGRAGLPLDFVQIDDGYQTQVGDWFGTKPTFPSGLRWLTDQVRAQALTPGVWLAPYIVRNDALLWRDHPDWLLRGANRRPANAGYVWFKWCYGLDPTHPGVREHTRRLITAAMNEWGFPYLKLDFLYAAALPGRRYDSRLTRAQAMRLALTDLRAAAGPETFLLGCGCPLGSAVGIVDGMRISADVAPDWLPVLFSPAFSPLLRQEREMPSARNAIQNIITRAPLHRRWWLNDPDCLLARDHDTRLTEAEVCSLATAIALSGGMFLVSDDLAHLNPERLRYVTALLPVLTESARAPGWLSETTPALLTLPLSGPAGPWRVAGLFNWDDAARDCTWPAEALGLAAGRDYWVSDFWGGRQWRVKGGEPLTLKAMPPHGAHLVAIRPVEARPALVASTFHFSQGKEVAAWEVVAGELRLKLELGRVAEGELRLALPAMPQKAAVDGQPAAVRAIDEGLYALSLTVNQTAEVALTLG